MSASLFRRIFSSFVDLLLIFFVVYMLFIIGGRSILQNRVDDFDIVYENYNEILEAYNSDLQLIQTEYEVNMEIANGDPELEAIATETYNYKAEIIDQQNTIDIEPYNLSLTQYFLEIIYFFAFGFIIVLTIVTVLTTGKTPGRRLMKVHLVTEKGHDEFAEPNPFQVFFHDIILKYFFIIIIFTLSMYYGFIFIMVGLFIDILLISLTRKKFTIRDYFLRMRVLGSGRGY